MFNGYKLLHREVSSVTGLLFMTSVQQVSFSTSMCCTIITCYSRFLSVGLPGVPMKLILLKSDFDTTPYQLLTV